MNCKCLFEMGMEPAEFSQHGIFCTVGLEDVMGSKPGIYFETAKKLHFCHPVAEYMCHFFPNCNSTKMPPVRKIIPLTHFQFVVLCHCLC